MFSCHFQYTQGTDDRNILRECDFIRTPIVSQEQGRGGFVYQQQGIALPCM